MPAYDMAGVGVANAALAGPSYDRLVLNRGDPAILRPFIGKDGRYYTTQLVKNERTGDWEHKAVLTNTASSLTYDAWKQFDNVVIQVLRERLTAVMDLRSRGLVYNLPGGMAHTILQYQTMGDITGATVSMSPTRRSEGDRAESDVATFPLPIVHKDFDIDERELMASRMGMVPMPLDTTTAALAARKVAEELEKMLVGTVTPFTYGGGTVYGYITHPDRATKTDMTVPDGTNGPTVLNDLLVLRQLLIDNRHYGPYVLYLNSQWSEVLDNDFSTAKGADTLRQRILRLPDITDIKILDHLPSTRYHAVLVEMKAENVRLIVGSEVQTVQWESMGGFMRHYKVMALQVPQIRADTAGEAGIAHGTTS